MRRRNVRGHLAWFYRAMSHNLDLLVLREGEKVTNRRHLQIDRKGEEAAMLLSQNDREDDGVAMQHSQNGRESDEAVKRTILEEVLSQRHGKRGEPSTTKMLYKSVKMSQHRKRHMRLVEREKSQAQVILYGLLRLLREGKREMED
jgi:hypothetical protein